MATLEHAYRYVTASDVMLGCDGTWVELATCDGHGPEGPLERPRFFSGFLDHPEQMAAGLLAVARTARSRFYDPAAVRRAGLLDPVVTSDGSRLRFESFSACCGVGARLDVLPGGMDTAPLAAGTTNVDVNEPLRQELAIITDQDPLHLQVGAEDVIVTTMDGEFVERRVPLPERWLKGFAEVQVAAAGMRLQAELHAAEARAFLRALPRPGSRGSAIWLTRALRGLRVTGTPGPGVVCLSGPQRLELLRPLLPFARALRVYGPDLPRTTGRAALAPSAWELELADARLTLVLSPQLHRGFSGEGGVLDILVDPVAAEDAELLSVLLGWDARIEAGVLSARAGLPADRVTAALSYLGAAGRVGFDLAEGAFFHRELPYDVPGAIRTHPRLRAARRLAAAGAVTLHADDPATVRVTHQYTGEPLIHHVDGDRCTCLWWERERGRRGPCQHVLAVRIARRDPATTGDAGIPEGDGPATTDGVGSPEDGGPVTTDDTDVTER